MVTRCQILQYNEPFTRQKINRTTCGNSSTVYFAFVLVCGLTARLFTGFVMYPDFALKIT